jgi:DNA mismatch endonuclease (patch repair protein)
MADTVDPATRSRMMAGIGAKNTTPELAVRRFLFRRGYRYRLHVRGLPGRPDLVLRRANAVILVHGCFWHRHASCKFAYRPKSNTAFWDAKFAANMRRDKEVRASLRDAGWRVLVIWECQVNERGLSRLAKQIEE